MIDAGKQKTGPLNPMEAIDEGPWKCKEPYQESATSGLNRIKL